MDKLANQDSMENFDTHESEASKMASRVIEMENQYDNSMEGSYLDKVITAYVQIKGELFRTYYEYIVANQKEKYDTYGDIDTAVRKLEITDFKPHPVYVNYLYEVSGIYLADIFSGRYYVIIKVIRKPKDTDKLLVAGINWSETYYHIRELPKETKKETISYPDHVQYGDCRDKGYIVSYKTDRFEDDKLETVDHRGMDYTYWRFKQFMFALSQPHYELSHNED